MLKSWPVLSATIWFISILGAQTEIKTCAWCGPAVPLPQARAQVEEANAELRRNPRDAMAYVRRGSALLMSRAPRERPSFANLMAAVYDLEAALKLDPNNFYAHHNYAEAASWQGYWQLATDHYNRALQIKPDSARTFLGRAFAELHSCKLTDSGNDYRKALQLDPSLRNEAASPQEVRQQKASCEAPHPAPVVPACAQTAADRERLARWYELHGRIYDANVCRTGPYDHCPCN